ncbi:MAG: ATP-binding cassette domain-containing protein, partial [Candidatus Bathyarchaeia archaeon]
EDLKGRKSTNLSGGEAQRVSLARVLVYNPSLVLLDEPTANLDPPNVALFESLLKRINQEHKTTIVLATHNMFQARRLSDRVGLLFNGELVELTDKETFFTNPQSNLSRAFVQGELIF